ncbi:Scr1 family TA system antitoxin-like transcriptional regulator [Plantactinospora solaniradicis]|uniref:Scr1 family TA system antitoxin-like transcriptional regulator n=1 Tax=Plantactinospora solaniradicis TaxID=1723736 RepID=A0ABW1KNU0_9ACTN
MNDLRELLRRERTKRGMTQDQAGAAIKVSGSSIGGFESGRMVPMPDTAKTLDDLFGTGDEIQRLSAEAREEAQAPWLRPWTDNERRATLLRWFEHSVIPGLLQTEDYARAILTVGPHTPEQVAEMTASRLARQAATLERPDPPTLAAIIGEPALRYGGPTIMKDQLEHLVDIGHRPTVHLRVIPGDVGLHAGLAGAFVVATLPGGSRLGYLDDQLRGRVVSDVDEVGDLERTWESLSAVALPRDQSRDIMLKVIDEYS